MKSINHGTPSGYSAHRRRKEDACDPCKVAVRTVNREREARQIEAESALTGGEWRPSRHGILRWFPALASVPTAPSGRLLVLPAPTLAEAASQIVETVEREAS